MGSLWRVMYLLRKWNIKLGEKTVQAKSKEVLNIISEGEDIAVVEDLLEIRVRNWIDNLYDE